MKSEQAMDEEDSKKLSKKNVFHFYRGTWAADAPVMIRVPLLRYPAATVVQALVLEMIALLTSFKVCQFHRRLGPLTGYNATSVVQFSIKNFPPVALASSDKSTATINQVTPKSKCQDNSQFLFDRIVP